MLMDLRPSRGGSNAEPWRDEPNRVAWRDAGTGYQCLILRGELGNLCGYVRVPRGHRLHGKDYRKSGARGLYVHGGLTFSGCIGGRRMKRGHWFGFDCAHYQDLIPAMNEALELFGLPWPKSIYRTVEYVRAECSELARQLARKAQ